MKGQLRGLAGPMVKLVIFGLVTVLASYVLISTITNAGYGKQVTYRAQFTDVAGLVEGDEVRIAGVRVGQVTGIGLTDKQDRPTAEVELEVSADVPIPAAVQATIKYRNLVGQRYIALTEAKGSGGRTLEEGGVIPLAQTKPALDLTTLFGGFRPLLQALSPADMNRVSFEIIQVFQGEGGTVESLLNHVASLTELAGRQGRRHRQRDRQPQHRAWAASPPATSSCPDLIVSLQQFVTGLAGDRDAIFNSLQTIDTLATTTSGFLERRPPAAGRRHPGAGRPVGQPRRQRRRARGLPAARPDEDRPDHPHRHQRQLVQLLHVQRVGLRRPPGHRARTAPRPASRCRPATA